MKVLLDTHILLWALADSPMLSTKARTIIGDESNECFYSPVSLTEISIKHRLHPNNMVLTATDARAAFLAAGFRELPFVSRHATGMDSLPSHHADPFDRMLIAQAAQEGIQFVSHDDMVTR